MPDLTGRILDLLNEILGTRKNMQSKIYRDEPIVRRASDLPRKEPAMVPKPAPALPEPLRAARALAASSAAFYLSKEELFYRQALQLKEYRDDYEYRGASFHYQPSYQSLSDPQLRGYFTWRTAWLAGEDVHGCADFYKLRIYEILHQIAVPDPPAGYQELTDLGRKLSMLEPGQQSNIPVWQRDYILYYHLDLKLPGEEAMQDFDRTLSVIFHPEEQTPQAFLEALHFHSSYNFLKSPFYREHADFCARTVYRYYLALTAYYAKHRKTSLEESLFGRAGRVAYVPFAEALFFDYMQQPDFTFQAAPYTTFACRGHWWTLTRYQGAPGKNKEVGRMLRAADRILRECFADPRMLRDDGRTPKYAEQLLVRVIEELRKEDQKPAEEPAQEPTVLHFDLSGLDAIRRAADRTRDSLIVEEEPEAEVPVVPVTMPVVEMPDSPDTSGSASLLSASEQHLLSDLLNGTPYAGWLQAQGLMLSVLVDSINDKLYDEFADTVILFDGADPAVIEEYREDLYPYIS